MRTRTLLPLTCILTAIAVLWSFQDVTAQPPQGKGPPPGKGKPAGGPKGIKEPALFKLLVHPAILDELNVTDRQLDDLDLLQDQFAEMASQSLKESGLESVEPKDRKNHREQFDALDANSQDWLIKRLDVLLTNVQMQRLREIDFQMRSGDLAKDKTLLSKLQITESQQRAIEAIRNLERQELDMIRKTARELIPAAELQDYLKEEERRSQQRIESRLQKVLTPQQASILQRLKGRPFDVSVLKGGGKDGKPPKGPKPPKEPKPEKQPEL